MLHAAVARPSSDDGAIRYVLSSSDVVDDVLFSHNGANGPESIMTICFGEFATWRNRDEVDVYDCRLVRSNCIDGACCCRCRLVFLSSCIHTCIFYLSN